MCESYPPFRQKASVPMQTIGMEEAQMHSLGTPHPYLFVRVCA